RCAAPIRLPSVAQGRLRPAAARGNSSPRRNPGLTFPRLCSGQALGYKSVVPMGLDLRLATDFWLLTTVFNTLLSAPSPERWYDFNEEIGNRRYRRRPVIYRLRSRQRTLLASLPFQQNLTCPPELPASRVPSWLRR